MPPSSDEVPGRTPPKKKDGRAQPGGRRRRGKQPGAPGAAMRWEVPDDTIPHFPEGTCACGRDLAEARDLGVASSAQQLDIPEPRARRIQHDMHAARCACGREHIAARPAGVPDAPLSIGPGLRALTVYLLVYQHVPVERCRQLIADLAGAEVSSTGSSTPACAKPRPPWPDVVKLIKTLITAAHVVGVRRDHAARRAGRGQRSTSCRRVHRAVHALFHLGGRRPGVVPARSGSCPASPGSRSRPVQELLAQGLETPRRDTRSALSHLLRDFTDAAESYPGAGLARAGAARAARADPRLATQARDAGHARDPRRGPRPAGQPSSATPSRVGLAERPPRTPARRTAAPKQKPGRELLEFCRDRRGRRAAVHHRHPDLADEQHQRARRPPDQDPAEDLRPAHQRRRHPGPPRHPHHLSWVASG